MKNYISFIKESLDINDYVLVDINRHRYLTGEVKYLDAVSRKFVIKLDREVIDPNSHRGVLFYAIKTDLLKKITKEERDEYIRKYSEESEELVNPDIDPYGEEFWNESMVYEKLGVSDVVYRTAEKIYDMYDLEQYQKMNRNFFKKKILLDTSQLEHPFNDMILTLIFDDKYRPKKVHGGIDRIDVNVFNVFVYYTSNNVFRTLAHELDHVYQVYLKKRHFSTNKETPSPFRRSEESPTIMSVYTQLKQRGVESKQDFVTKLKKLPKYKRYIKILDDPNETPEHKRHAIKMTRKMHKLYGLFENE